ncbi:hypothetical protein [Aquimarina sp. AU58]|uniref:hypothetical protein n=1 Tax=Aquimarina sp. AU58 TaxID=1874112 RepID=UPI000D653548|nr:hypothetical protein [Aquimarina sp. AU58]
MKNLKFLLIQITSIAFLTILFSCEKENINKFTESEDAYLSLKVNNTQNKSADLRPVVNGSNFRRFYIDANGDGHTDLVAIKTRNTGTRSTEIHVIDGKSKFTKFSIQTGTALHETNSDWDFLPAVTRRGGKFGLQIFAIKKRRTGTNKTEIHVLSQNYYYFSRFTYQLGTFLHKTDASYQFKIKGVQHNNFLYDINVFKNGRFYALLKARNLYR